MSSILESAARKAKGALTGVVNPQEQHAAQTTRGNELVRNLAVGGLALGGGVSAAVALINYLKSLRDENEMEDASRLNDDTLYIKSMRKQSTTGAKDPGGINRWLAPGAALTGGILSAAGAYALTQSIYNYLQKKRRQSMLDEAQGEALDAANVEVQKSAAEQPPAKMTFFDLVTAFPVAIPLLAALASGGVAYTALNKTFPVIQTPKSKYPKRIRQVASTGQVEELPAEAKALLKSGSDLAAERDCTDAANEFLMLLVDQMAHEKNAAICLTSDILNRVAKGGYTELVELQKVGGMQAVVEAVKGASDEPADMPNKVLAAAVLCKSARLRPVVTALAAAEFSELTPGVYETALSFGAEQLEKFAGVAPLMHLAFFRPLMLEKSAASSELMELLQGLLARHAPQGRGQVQGQGDAPSPAHAHDPEMDEALTSDVSGGMAEEAEGHEAEGGYRADIEMEDRDPVDDFMEAGGDTSPLLDPHTVAADEEGEKDSARPAVLR